MGLARKIVRASAVHDSSKGTYGWAFYIAPEQIEALENADARSDVYQLGKTLYAMLTNAQPHNMTAGRVTPGLYHIIKIATRDDPDERYQSVEALRTAVDSYLPSLIRTQRPLEVFQELVGEVVVKLRAQELTPEDCLPILDALNNVKNDSFEFIPFFEQLHVRVIGIIVRGLETEFVPIFRAYDNNIEEYVNQEKSGKYEYAEKIAEQMLLCIETPTTMSYNASRSRIY